MQITEVRSAARARASAASRSAMVFTFSPIAPNRLRVLREVDRRRTGRGLDAVLEEVVERLSPVSCWRRLMQP